MKQVAQRGHNSFPTVYDVPVPALGPQDVLVSASRSILSAGTERAKVQLASAGILEKARRRPDLARQVLAKLSQDGVSETVRAVRTRLDALAPLGYSAAGTVVAVGPQVQRITVGDRVACGGAEAGHAELMAVPEHLCVRVPSTVSDEEAAFTTIGSIALHSFRQGEAQVGERVAIIGLGLVGQLLARIATSAGCRVLGIDRDEELLRMAASAGAAAETRLRESLTSRDRELGTADVVLVTAASSSNDPVVLGVDLARDRGRIVIVGEVPIEIDRKRFYEKELDLRIARSYGPGRYDREYEERGLDYPISYVRWTEQRNMGAVLELMAAGRLQVRDLVTHRFSIDDAADAYAMLVSPRERTIAVAITYDGPVSTAAESGGEMQARQRLGALSNTSRSAPVGAAPRLGFIGAGSFAQRHLIPAAQAAGCELWSVATASGLSARSVAERFHFQRGPATVQQVLGDSDVDAVVIASRHGEHGLLTLNALRAGKHVFVEKPLCLSVEDLDAISSELVMPGAPVLMVGFNRRYAPLTRVIQDFIADEAGPVDVVMRVNAGPLAQDHWLNDRVDGGGRLLGEGCHFIDLANHIVGEPPSAVTAMSGETTGDSRVLAQDFYVGLGYTSGSLASILYCSRGSASLGKELYEVHRGGRSVVVDDFARATLYGGSPRPRRIAMRQKDKGHRAEVQVFADAIRGRVDRPDPQTYITTTRTALAAAAGLTGGRLQLEN